VTVTGDKALEPRGGGVGSKGKVQFVFHVPGRFLAWKENYNLTNGMNGV
jgi:hypothetical protein